jgi:hypothetical protein
LSLSERRAALLSFGYIQQPGSLDVDLALRLDVLAVCAVFGFLAAILLGAF